VDIISNILKYLGPATAMEEEMTRNGRAGWVHAFTSDWAWMHSVRTRARRSLEQMSWEGFPFQLVISDM
jgi:hypothetical protein